MWGANPQSQAMYYYKPSWEGITRFKKGWGGRLVNFVGTWDLPFNTFLYRLAFLNKFLRG
jgi:lipid II:glycine glycyltransferase (peptidoglycan interpeptide bridge formation enzyme)